MKIWEDERQCYIRAAMEKNSEAENEALKAQLDAIDWSVLEQIERKETVNERGVFAPLRRLRRKKLSGAGTSSGNSASRRSGKEKSERFFWRGTGNASRTGQTEGNTQYRDSPGAVLFQQLIRNLMDVTDEAGAYVPLYIMTSNINHDDTQAFLRSTVTLVTRRSM